MRIAIATRSRRLVGGAETVLVTPLVDWMQAGHDLALWHEIEGPRDRAVLPVPRGAASWCAAEAGADGSLAALRAWRPDVVVVHGLEDPALERRVAGLAPAVFFAHNYYGTCISGNKTLAWPRTRPCVERFGWPCLLRYYPRRTGGLNPATMVRRFRRQAQRLAVLRSYRFLAVLSEHMRAEYLRHGFATDRVVRVPPPAPPGPEGGRAPHGGRTGAPTDELSLLFVGRMDPLKGGAQLLRAAGSAARALRRPVAVTLAGDGPSRRAWERLASQLLRHHAGLRVRFPGWVPQAALPELFEVADLLAVPSLWPEPFGLIGLEAAAFSLPAVAYAVGGIPEWLRDGVNGHLAPGDPPTVDGLTDAILRAVRDPAHHAAMRTGAADTARSVAPGAHARELLHVLQRAAGTEGLAAPRG